MKLVFSSNCYILVFISVCGTAAMCSGENYLRKCMIMPGLFYLDWNHYEELRNRILAELSFHVSIYPIEVLLL